LKNKQDGVLDKDRMMDNVQKRNICIEAPVFLIKHYAMKTWWSRGIAPPILSLALHGGEFCWFHASITL
jgi:hypothetical protein